MAPGSVSTPSVPTDAVDGDAEMADTLSMAEGVATGLDVTMTGLDPEESKAVSEAERDLDKARVNNLW